MAGMLIAVGVAAGCRREPSSTTMRAAAEGSVRYRVLLFGVPAAEAGACPAETGRAAEAGGCGAWCWAESPSTSMPAAATRRAAAADARRRRRPLPNSPVRKDMTAYFSLAVR